MSEAPVLEVRDLHVSYPDRRRGGGRGGRVAAVRGVSLEVRRGEALGIVGESGCGKSSLARALVGVVAADAGAVLFEGVDLAASRADDPRAAARAVQMVFQDAAGALDPRQRVGAALREVLAVHGLGGDDGGRARTRDLLERVGLGAEHADRFPHQLSGGQRQRVGIARALAPEPDVLVLDEPVSALDVSVQAQILALVEDLRRRLGLTVLLIAHDLAVVRNVCDRVTVMYRGRVAETASSETLFAHPRHPYTRELLAAVPRLGESGGSFPSYGPAEPRPREVAGPSGCPYHARCTHPRRDALCVSVTPVPSPVEAGHFVACLKET